MAKLTAGEIIWKINGDPSGMNKAVDSAEKKAKGLGATWKNVAGKIGIALAAIGVGAITKELIKAASDAEETANKFGVVFRTVSEEANSMAQNLATNYGLSRTESKKLLSDTGDLLSGFGMTGKEALELSGRVQMLAADLASFSNVQGGIAFASEALTKGLFGETEQMKSLGIVINQNSQEFKNSVKYYQDVEKKTLLQAKAMTILDMATSQSGNAIGDFQRSMSSFANQSRIAEANIQNLKESLGTKLLPVAGLVVKAFNALVPEIEKAANGMNDFVTSAEGSEKIGEIFGTIAGAITAAWELIQPILEAGKNNFSDFINIFKEFAPEAGYASSVTSILSNILTILAKVFRALFLIIIGLVKAIIRLSIAIYKSGKMIGSFFLALSEKGSWEDFKKEAKSAGGAFADFGKGIVEDSKNVGKAVGQLFDAEVANKVAKNANEAYMKNHRNAKTFVVDALLAKQAAQGQALAINSVAGASLKGADAVSEMGKSAKNTGEDFLKLQEKLEGISGRVMTFLGLKTQEAVEKLSGFDIAIEKILGKFQKLKESGNTTFTKLIQEISDFANMVSYAFTGVMDGLQSIQQARLQNEINALDSQMQAEIEAAGVAEETQQEKLQKEIDLAEKSGDKITAGEKKRELERYKIQQKYAEKRKELEYEMALMQWKYQVAAATASVPLAILNAFTAGSKWGVVVAGIYAAIAGVAASLQLAGVVAAKPQAYQTGGIVPGSSPAGDNVAAMVNSGEMILNGAQQKRLFNIAEGKQAGQMGSITIHLGDELIYKSLYNATKSGDLLIDSRAVVAR